MEVDALKSSGAKPSGDKTAAGSAVQTEADHMLYQLHYRPEEAKFTSTARVCELHKPTVNFMSVRKLALHVL